MKTTELPDVIKNATFLMVCSGETYSADIIKGHEAHAKMMEAIFGEAQNAPQDQSQAYAEELADVDNWCHDQDYGPTRYRTDVGETDHIELLRITDKSVVA